MSLEIFGDGIIKKNGNTALSINNTPQVSFENSVSQPGGFSFRNRLINGDMRIDQRNNGASVTPTDGQFITDRWSAWRSQTSKLTWQQNSGSVTPPTRFTNYLGAISSSAYSIISTDYFFISQVIEGFNVADLGWGTANAQTVTLSFWIRSSLTGAFSGSLRNGGSNRSYAFIYTISSANTWEYKTVTITGDTTGTWLTNAGRGLLLTFCIGSGSTRLTTADSWQAGDFDGVTGTTSVVGTNGATFYITGVQLEAGAVATPFEQRPFGAELQLCQRYYESGGFFHVQSNVTNGTNIGTTVWYKQKKRVNPTITQISTSVFNVSTTTQNASLPEPITQSGDTTVGFLSFRTATSSASGSQYTEVWTASAEL